MQSYSWTYETSVPRAACMLTTRSHYLSDLHTCLLMFWQQSEDSLLTYFLDLSEELNLAVTGPILDEMADAITQVKVVGTVESETKSNTTVEKEAGSEIGVSVDSAKAGFSAKSSDKGKESRGQEHRQ